MLVWTVWLIVGVAGVIFFTTLIIPKIMTKLYASTLAVRVKAVDRSKGEYGDIVTYVPSALIGRYIRRYRVGHDKDGIYFVGDLAMKVAYAEYELIVYNADSEIIQILRVKDKFNETGETSVIRLPQKTDYVGIKLIYLDDEPISYERKKFGARYFLWLALLCLSIVAMTDILIWLILSYLIRWDYGYETLVSLPSSIWAKIFGITSAVVTFIVCCLCIGKALTRVRGNFDE